MVDKVSMTYETYRELKKGLLWAGFILGFVAGAVFGTVCTQIFWR